MNAEPHGELYVTGLYISCNVQLLCK